MKKIILFAIIIFSSGIANAQWTQTSMVSGYVRCLATDGANIYAGTDGNGLFESNDFGASWHSINSGLGAYNIWCLYYGNNKLYAGSTNGIFLSEDNGNTWSSISNNLQTNQKCIWTIEVVDTLIFIGTANGNGSILRACTNNYIWSLKYSTTPYIPAIHFYSGRLLASIETHGVISSDDYGNSWNPCNGSSHFYILQNMVQNDTTVYAAFNYLGAYKYYTNSNIWEPSGLQDVSYLQSIVTSDSIIAASSRFDEEGVFISFNLGNSWDTINDGLIDKNITALLYVNNCLYAGTEGNGVWKRDIVTSNRIKKSYATQIFPNPATDLVYINCEEKATVEIMNVQGQIVSTCSLPDKTNTINISNLSPGLYNLRIISKNDIAYRKVVKQ